MKLSDLQEADQRYVVFLRSDVGEEVLAHNVTRDAAFNEVHKATAFQLDQEPSIRVKQEDANTWTLDDHKHDMVMTIKMEPVRPGNVYGDNAEEFNDDD